LYRVRGHARAKEFNPSRQEHRPTFNSSSGRGGSPTFDIQIKGPECVARGFCRRNTRTSCFGVSRHELIRGEGGGRGGIENEKQDRVRLQELIL
jgi:hypothetical protein